MVNNLVEYRIMCCNFVFQKLKSSFILCVCTCVCKCVGMFVNVYGAQRLMLGAFTLNRKTPNEAKLTEHQAPGVTLSLPSTCCHARNSTWTRSVWTHVLMLPWKALYWHFPSRTPHTLFLNSPLGCVNHFLKLIFPELTLFNYTFTKPKCHMEIFNYFIEKK